MSAGSAWPSYEYGRTHIPMPAASCRGTADSHGEGAVLWRVNPDANILLYEDVLASAARPSTDIYCGEGVERITCRPCVWGLICRQCLGGDPFVAGHSYNDAGLLSIYIRKRQRTLCREVIVRQEGGQCHSAPIGAIT